MGGWSNVHRDRYGALSITITHFRCKLFKASTISVSFILLEDKVDKLSLLVTRSLPEKPVKGQIAI